MNSDLAEQTLNTTMDFFRDRENQALPALTSLLSEAQQFSSLKDELWL